MAVRLPPAEQRLVDDVVARMRAPDIKPDERKAIRREVLRSGLWEVLAARSPKHFGEAFELNGTGPTSTLEPVLAERAPQPVPFDRVEALAGKEACLRIRRADGRTEIVAGKLGEVYPEEIVFGDFDVATAERLAQPGDAPLFRRGLDRRSSWGIVLERDDVVVSAVKLPVDLMQPGAAPHKRTSMRERAEAVARGEYAPRVDLTDPAAHLVATLGPDGRPDLVFRADFVAAVKVEQNVLATPLVHAIAERAVAALRSDAVVAKLGSVATWKALDDAVFKEVATLVADLVKEWTSTQGRESPLGRAYANLQRVTDFGHTFLPNQLAETFGGSAERLLKSGLSTALAVMSDLGAVATAKAKERPELSVAELVRASAPVPLRMASAHMEVFLAMHAVLGMGLKANVDQQFELSERNGKYRLEPKASAIELLATKHGLRPETVLLGTTGCPAAQSLGAGNPVQQLTDAFADMLGKLGKLPERVA